MSYMKNNMILYYGRQGGYLKDGKWYRLPVGNPEIVAGIIKEAVGGDTFAISPKKKYAEDYYECMKEAENEQNSGAQVAVNEYCGDLEDYRTIFLGVQNWWGTMPRVVFSFLNAYNLKGIRIVPFCTHGGEGPGNCEADLKKLCAGAEIKPMLSIDAADIEAMKEQIRAWAEENVQYED